MVLTVDTVLRYKGAGSISKDPVLQEFDIGADHNTMACYFLSWVSFIVEPWKNNVNNNVGFQIFLYQWHKHSFLLIIKKLFNNLIEMIPATFQNIILH